MRHSPRNPYSICRTNRGNANPKRCLQLACMRIELRAFPPGRPPPESQHDQVAVFLGRQRHQPLPKRPPQSRHVTLNIPLLTADVDSQHAIQRESPPQVRVELRRRQRG